MSANIQESETTGRKRSHDEFAGDTIKVEGPEDVKPPTTTSIQPPLGFLPLPTTDSLIKSSPQGSPALSEPTSSTPACKSSSPETPTKITMPDQNRAAAIGPQALSISVSITTKRKKLTPSEREAHEKELARKKKERDEEMLAKAAKKAKQEEEKAAKAKEREEKRKKKDEEDRIKQQQREDKKRKKEEEQQRLQEEKDRKARSQKTLNFFVLQSTRKKSDGETAGDEASPAKNNEQAENSKLAQTEYRRRFKPFYIRKDTHLAGYCSQMDEETRQVKSQILDEHISGKRGQDTKVVPFNAVDQFAFPAKTPTRGKIHHPVKHIMESFYRESETSVNADADHAQKIMVQARQMLAKVPMKVIAFSQDVRPPYYGTVTFKPFVLGQGNMVKLARRTISRRLPLDYDYDSEAEWQEEEGEDVDMDDDEEELDEEDDMEGFLDDSEDAGLSRRFFASTMEPESTGLCFEDHDRRVANQIVYDHKMEFIHEGFENSLGIDPFSTQYWEPQNTAKAAKGPQKTDGGVNMPPPPAPSNAFAALSSTKVVTEPVKLVKSELMNDVKKAILNNKALSKAGIIDYIFQQFRDNVSRTEVKNTLEHVAEKTGKGQGRQKTWELKPGHEISS